HGPNSERLSAMPHPFIRTAATAAGPGEPAGTPSPPVSTPARGKHVTPAGSLAVFVVDDNDGFREMLVALLEAGGHRVVGEAGDGRAALDLIPKTDPDVVLMDIRMPLLDGVEATRRLKAWRSGIGVVALTANDDQTVVREMLVAGASGYVLKDSDGDVILNAVAEAAHGGAVLSPGVTPAVIEQLTEALEQERQRARELEE